MSRPGSPIRCSRKNALQILHFSKHLGPVSGSHVQREVRAIGSDTVSKRINRGCKQEVTVEINANYEADRSNLTEYGRTIINMAVWNRNLPTGKNLQADCHVTRGFLSVQEVRQGHNRPGNSQVLIGNFVRTV